MYGENKAPLARLYASASTVCMYCIVQVHMYVRFGGKRGLSEFLNRRNASKKKKKEKREKRNKEKEREKKNRRLCCCHSVELRIGGTEIYISVFKSISIMMIIHMAAVVVGGGGRGGRGGDVCIGLLNPWVFSGLMFSNM